MNSKGRQKKKIRHWRTSCFEYPPTHFFFFFGTMPRQKAHRRQRMVRMNFMLQSQPQRRLNLPRCRCSMLDAECALWQCRAVRDYRNATRYQNYRNRGPSNRNARFSKTSHIRRRMLHPLKKPYLLHEPPPPRRFFHTTEPSTVIRGWAVTCAYIFASGEKKWGTTILILLLWVP